MRTYLCILLRQQELTEKHAVGPGRLSGRTCLPLTRLLKRSINEQSREIAVPS
jgi:hypothetical protein